MKKIASLMLATIFFSTFALPALAQGPDEEKPDDVESLDSTPLDGEVELTWTATTDNVGVVGYKIAYGNEPKTNQSGEYTEEIDTGADVLKYTVPNLENGTTYYFAVVAYDAAGNESLSYSPEASATPVGEVGEPVDEDAPQVSDAEAINMEQVKIVFSEEIVLPEEDPEDAFTIENNDTFEPLPVLAAEMDEEDETNMTVILSTEAQEENAEYKLTVGIDVKDVAGNPIISGTSDTAIFIGSALEKPIEVVEGPEIVDVEVVDSTHVGVNFNETIVLSIDPSRNFNFVAEDDDSKELTVLGVRLGPNSEGIDDTFALVTTSPQENINYVLTVSGLTDEDGNEISPDNNTAVFEGMAEVEVPEDVDDVVDVIPPSDVANFLAKKMLDAQKYALTFTWNVLDDTDSVAQNFYMSLNSGDSYTQKAELGPDVEKYEMKSLDPGEYWFKLTQEDMAGNESEGVITKVILSETGPEMVGLLLVSLVLGRVVGKRKKRQ